MTFFQDILDVLKLEKPFNCSEDLLNTSARSPVSLTPIARVPGVNYSQRVQGALGFIVLFIFFLLMILGVFR